MFLKQLNKDKNYIIKLENKLLSQTVYNKLFIRSNFLLNKNLKVVDNNTKFYIFKTHKNTLQFANGNASLLHVFLLKHKLNTYFNFEYLINFNFVKSTSSEEKSLFFLYIKNRTPIFFLILYPVKGGYICFSLGIRAFLPLSHMKNILKKRFDSKGSKLQYSGLFFNKINFLCIHKKFNFIKNNLIFKLLGQLSKKFTLSFLKRDNLFKKRKLNTSTYKLKKRNITLRYSNFIFLKDSQKTLSKKKKTTLTHIRHAFRGLKINKLKKLLKLLFYLRFKKKKKVVCFWVFSFLLKYITFSRFNGVLKSLLKTYIVNLFKKSLVYNKLI